jgi:hypothetical protein
MTKTYEYNENLVITNEDTHSALVSHFNQIQELGTNKKFEWEDETIPEENYNITFDFDEWLENAVTILDKYFERWSYEKPENLKEDTINYTNQIKNYVDGFLLGPTALYNRKSIEVKSYKNVGENFDEIVKFVKELKENNKLLFLYEVSKTPSTETYGSFYRVRYSILN